MIQDGWVVEDPEVDPWDDYVFIDAETTGLNWREHSLIEVTYAIGQRDPVTLFADFGINLQDADPMALEVNQVLERFKSEDEIGHWWEVPDGMGDPGCYGPRPHRWLKVPREASVDDWEKFLVAIKGRTWVGANPSFDVNFIQDFLYPDPLEHHYHLFDIRSWWKGVNGSYNMKSRDDVDKFEDIPNPQYKADHTSRNDVLAMREALLYHVDVMGLGI